MVSPHSEDSINFMRVILSYDTAEWTVLRHTNFKWT